MKAPIIKVLLLSALLFSLKPALAARSSSALIAVPTVSYTPATNIYVMGTAISTLTPASSSVSAQGTYGTGAAFGSGYSGPEATAFDASGNFYVTNVTNNTIRKFNSSGTFISTFGTGLNQPNGITFDASNNAYITNTGTNSIIKITSAGVQSTLITGLNYPGGAATDASGNIYVANYGTSAILKYSSTGTLLQTISTSSNPSNVTLDASGNIYALTYAGGTVLKYNAAGTLQSTLTPNVAGLGLNNPTGITIDASGNLYIADSGNNRVLEYNASNTLIANIATGLLTSPRGTAIDASGNLYVTLNTTSTVLKYAPTGGYFINQALPAGLSFSSSTGVISGTPATVLASTNFTVYAYNSSGSASTIVNITVNPAAPSATATSGCGAGNQTISASGGLPSGGTYNWYNVAAGGTALQSSTSAIYSAYVAATSTYYVSYTVSGVTSARTAVTATVNPAVTSPISGAVFSYPFSGNAADASGKNNTGIVSGATLTTDRFGTANSAYSFDGSTSYITSTTVYSNPTVFTISLWFNTTVAGGKLIGFGSSQTGLSANYDRHIYMSSTGQLNFGLYNNAIYTITTPGSYNDGNWHHVVVTVGSDGSTIYVDRRGKGIKRSLYSPAGFQRLLAYWL